MSTKHIQSSSLRKRQTGKIITAVTSFSVRSGTVSGGGGRGGVTGWLAKLIYASSRLSCTSFDLHIYGLKMLLLFFLNLFIQSFLRLADKC